MSARRVLVPLAHAIALAAILVAVLLLGGYGISQLDGSDVKGAVVSTLLIGGGIVVAATAGVSGFGETAFWSPQYPLEPWRILVTPPPFSWFLAGASAVAAGVIGAVWF